MGNKTPEQKKQSIFLKHFTILEKKLLTLKTFNSEFQDIQVWFTDENSQQQKQKTK